MFLLRVIFLVFTGPLYYFDSYGYVDFANLILGDKSWLHDAMLHTSYKPITAVRTIGFPAIIAASKFLFGNNFDYALVLFQSILSIFTSYLLFRLGLLLALRWWIALLGATFYSLSYILIYDLSVLTDSIFSNLFVLTSGGIAIGILNRSHPRRAQMLMLGICFSGALLLRDVGLYFVPSIALGIVLWTHQAGYRFVSQVIVVTLFILPSIAVWQGYKAWNQYRTGTPFMTTVHYTMLLPVIAIELKGRHVIRDNSLLAKAYLATAPENATKPNKTDKRVPAENNIGELIRWVKGRRYHKEAIKRLPAITNYIVTESGVEAPVLARLASDAFFSALFAAPDEFALYAVGEFWPDQLYPFFNVIEAPRTIINMGTNANIPTFGDRIRRLSTKGFNIQDTVWTFIEGGQRIISAVIFFAFMVGVPISAMKMWRKHKRIDRQVLVLLWFCFLYVGLTGMYSLVHLTVRYTMGVQALAILGGLTVLQGWIDRRVIG